MTSERWLQLLEVAPTDLTAFLIERKALGYTIVGRIPAGGKGVEEQGVRGFRGVASVSA